MADETDRRIEGFLSSAVAGHGPAGDELRRELRTHIEAMIEEAMLAGTPPQHAASDAIAAMGAPALLARAFRAIATEGPSSPVIVAGGARVGVVARRPWRLSRILLWGAIVAGAVQLQVLLLMYLYPS